MSDQELFDYMANEHGVTLLESDMAEIKRICGTALLEAFADFLHELPDEDGWEVGPMQVKWDKSGKLAEGPLWVGIDDTRRWAEMFIESLNTGGNAQ